MFYALGTFCFLTILVLVSLYLMQRHSLLNLSNNLISQLQDLAMNIYSIYVNPQKKNNNCIIIKQGFSLCAAILNIGWALYHRMWLLLLITTVTMIIAFNINSAYTEMMGPIAIMLIFGFCSNIMREYDLERKKYLLNDIILAHSEIEAELKFLERLSH